MTIKTRMACVGSALTLVFMTAVGFAASTEITWTDATGDHKWGTPGNWKGGAVPQGAGQAADIPLEMADIQVDDDSFDLFNSIDYVTQVAQEKRRTRVVVTTTGEKMQNVEMHHYATMVKRGPGTLTLKTSPANGHAGFCILEEGMLIMPREANTSSNGHGLGRFTVSNEAVLAFNPTAGRQYNFNELFCYGLITNLSASYSASIAAALSNVSNPSRLHGPIGGKISFTGAGSIYVHGTNNTFTGGINSFVSDVKRLPMPEFGVTKFGMKADKTSSIGAIASIEPNFGGFMLKYLGEGETTDKEYRFSCSQAANYPNKLFTPGCDAGETGGVTFTGKWYSDMKKMARLYLKGENANPCVLDNALIEKVDGGVTYPLYITKLGGGIWRMKYNASRTLSGAMAVRAGTLQFTSIDERGVNCALGTANNLYDCVTADPSDALRVRYAYAMGDAAAGTEGALEYVGTTGRSTASRPVLLEGDARFKATGAALGFGNLYTTSSVPVTVTLDGADATGSVIGRIMGTNGTVSIVKEGTGTWRLTDTNVITGTLEVKAGKLIVDTGRPYTYFRFTSYESLAAFKTPVTTYNYQQCFDEFALYDKDGVRQNVGYTYDEDLVDHPSATYYSEVWDFTGIKPGRMGHGRTCSFFFYAGINSSYSLSRVTNETADNGCYGATQDGRQNYPPLKDHPERRFAVVTRMAETANPVVAYDFCTSKTSPASVPNTFTLEGSADGVFWDMLHTVTNLYTTDETPVASVWQSNRASGEAFAAKAVRKLADGKGWGFSRSAPAACDQMAAIQSVSVAAGASLVREGTLDPTPISQLVVSASGMGTIEGFALAKTGSIDFTGVDETAKEIVIPADFSKLPDWMNLAGWSFTVNGEENAKFTMSVGPDGFRLCKKGLLLILR